MIRKRLPSVPAWLSARTVLYMVCGLILLFLIFPVFIIFPLSFSSARYLTFPPPSLSLQWWDAFFSDPKWTSAMGVSFKVAVVATVLAITLGTVASFALVRMRFRGKQLINSIILMPQVLPFIILAISLYFVFGRLHLIGNWIIVSLGHAVLALPLVVIIVSATLKGFDQTLEHAAMNLGANRLTTLRRITFPLIRPGILAAALFAFMTSFDELLIALFLGGERSATLPKRMWEGLRYEIDPVISVVATLLTTISITVLILIQLSRRQPKA